MGVLFVGDNGTELDMTIFDDSGLVDLSAVSSITAKFIRGDKTTFNKTLTITDAAKGACTTTLTSADLTVAGAYSFQIIIIFNDGKEFSGLPRKFVVKARS